jgi:methylmalonyl-CoA mutase N-terminal domain/subunit
VAIDTVEEYFDQIPPDDEMSVSMTMNGAVLPIMAFYIVKRRSKAYNLNYYQEPFKRYFKRIVVRILIFILLPSMKIIADIFLNTRVKNAKI